LELRTAVAERFRRRGADITPNHVLITSGSQQAIAILAQAALESKRRIVCESPSYQGVFNAFGAVGHWVESLPRDREGPIPGKFRKYRDGRPTLLYLCTLFHNPMGTNLSQERAAMIREWAEEQDALIISDEIFSDLSFADIPPSYFNAFGRNKTVVIGSLSKTFMPGLRIGWIVADPDRIRTFVSLKQAMDIGTPSLTQGIAQVLFESGDYERHVARARDHYRLRKEAAVAALKKFMPAAVTWTEPEGGFHLWVELPAGYSSIALYLLAIERGVGFHPGPQLDIDHRFLNGLRLSYGSLTPGEIREGIELLSHAVRALLSNPPSDPGLNGLGDMP
jgi:2-aminoadipate transaminase